MAKVMMNSLLPELTPQEITELEEEEKRPIVFDDDCTEMTREMLSQFHKMNMVTIGISSSNI